MNHREKLIENKRSNYPTEQGWIAGQFKLKASVTKAELKQAIDKSCVGGECEMPFYQKFGDGWVVVFFRAKLTANES